MVNRTVSDPGVMVNSALVFRCLLLACRAIDAALEARKAWQELPWHQRASIFLKAADLVAGPYRAKINAATMLAQSKNAYQAEIDAACEMADFFRFKTVCRPLKISDGFLEPSLDKIIQTDKFRCLG